MVPQLPKPIVKNYSSVKTKRVIMNNKLKQREKNKKNTQKRIL